MRVARLNIDLLRLPLAEPANEGCNAMPPIVLNVPFHEKDDAKQLGARWDAIRKTWFVPDYTDTAPFAKWLPQDSDINLRCTLYFIAQSVRACWHCDRDSHVFSFLLPRGHQTRQDSDASTEWEPQGSEAIIYYITQIPESVQMQMRSVTGHYRNDFSKTTQSFYWMNHCEHCGMKQGDGFGAAKCRIAIAALWHIVSVRCNLRRARRRYLSIFAVPARSSNNDLL